MSGWGKYAERMIGEVKNDDESTSIQYFEEKFEELTKKIDEIETRIRETENKGSFLMKLKHLKNSLSSHDGLGDYQSLSERIDHQIHYIEDLISKNRIRNSEIKKGLIEEVKQVGEIVNWKEATEVITSLKNRWIKTGNAEDNENESLEKEFWGYVNEFFEKKKEFFEDKKRLSEHYAEKYQEIVEEAKKIAENPVGDVKSIVKDLRDKWKQNGPVPAQIYQPLFSEFNDVIKRISRPNQGNISEIVESLEKIKTEKSAFPKDKGRQIHTQLKNIRPASKEEKEKKSKAFELLFFIEERNFLHALCLKKKKGFENLSVSEQKKFKKQVLLDLIDRDRSELRTIELNFEKFRGQNEKMNRIMSKKVEHQKQKISIKEQILLELYE